MSCKKIDHVKIGFGLLLADVIFSVIFIFSMGRTQRPSVLGEKAYTLNYGWYYLLDGEEHQVSLPCTLPPEAVSDGYAFIYHRISPDISGRSIGFYSIKQTLAVKISETQVYSWNKTGAPSWIKTFGWAFHIVDIPQNSVGQKLCLAIHTEVPDCAGRCSQVYVGTRMEIINKVVSECAPQAIISLILLSIGVFLLLVYVMFRKLFTKDRTIFVLALLSVVTGLWQLEESKMLYLFVTNQAVHWVLDYMLFLVLPVLLVPFVEEMTGRRDDIVFHILFWASIAIFIVDCVLQFTKVAAFTETLLPVQVIVLITCLYTMVSVVRGVVKKEKNTSGYLPAVGMLLVGVVVETVYYYLSNSASILLFGIMLLPFFLYIGINAYVVSSRKFRQAEQMEQYHQLAFIDFSTGVKSRTAFYEEIEKSPLKIEYTMYMFDLNNLKVINDTYGHLVGDKMMKEFADCAKLSFEAVGTVYRVGGDEFVVLCHDYKETELETCLATYKDLIAKKNDLPVQISASYGYVRFTPNVKEDFYAAQKRADANMYKMKRQYHLASGDRRAR